MLVGQRPVAWGNSMRYSRNPCLNLFSARQSCVLQSALGVIDRHIACIRSRRRKGEWLSGGSEVRASPAQSQRTSSFSFNPWYATYGYVLVHHSARNNLEHSGFEAGARSDIMLSLSVAKLSSAYGRFTFDPPSLMCANAVQSFTSHCIFILENTPFDHNSSYALIYAMLW